MRAVFGLTVAGGVALLTAAVWPGMLDQLVYGGLLTCITYPLLGCCFLLLIVLGLRDVITRPQQSVRRRWWGVRSVAVMFGTMGLLWLHVPQRVAFSFAAPDLRRLVDAAPVGDYRGGVELGRQAGPYRIDRYAADPRGGVFFRTATGRDGFGPDQMSYGFAFRPNGHGSPFGNARYRLWHLFGEWYVFAVSDD